MNRQSLSPEVEAAWLTPLPPEEFDRRLKAAMAELDGEEYENLASLLTWFQRRYPTPKERMQYIRRKYREWMRPMTPVDPAKGE